MYLPESIADQKNKIENTNKLMGSYLQRTNY